MSSKRLRRSGSIEMNLESERLLLRPLRLDDAEGNYPHWFNDDEVCRYNSHGERTYTKEMAKEYIEFVNGSNTHKVFAVIDKIKNFHIGNVSLQRIDKRNNNAEFAILIGEKKYWGGGFAYEAAKSLLRYGFDTLKLHRIYCGTSEANTPMQKLALRLGFAEEGRSREAFYKAGVFYDIIHYGLLGREYYFE